MIKIIKLDLVLLRVSLNCLMILSSHCRGGLLSGHFQSLEYQLTVIFESCHVFNPELLLSIFQFVLELPCFGCAHTVIVPAWIFPYPSLL